jgi:hypothetical protein
MSSELIALQAPEEEYTKTSKMTKGDFSEKSAKRVKTSNIKAKEWYVRLIAEAPASGLKDRSAQLGQLSGKKIRNKHSLKAIPPFSGNYLYIAFVDPDMLEPDQYKTNFHPKSKQDSWEFSVFSGDPEADIVLSWDGLYALDRNKNNKRKKNKKKSRRYHERFVPRHKRLSKMLLIDNLTGDEIPLVYNDEKLTYSFNMDGMYERTFTVLLTRKAVKSEEF